MFSFLARPSPCAADVDVRRQLVREAEVGAAVPHKPERGLVLAARVLAAAVLDVHHEGALVGEAVGRPRVSRVAVDGVAGAPGLSAAGGLDVHHVLELVLRAVDRASVSLHAEVGVGLASWEQQSVCQGAGRGREGERVAGRGGGGVSIITKFHFSF